MVGQQALQTQVVGRERVFSIFGKPRRDPPTANLDLTLGAACAEKWFVLFLPIFPVCSDFLFFIDVLPVLGNKLMFWRCLALKEIQLPACQALPSKL